MLSVELRTYTTGRPPHSFLVITDAFQGSQPSADELGVAQSGRSSQAA